MGESHRISYQGSAPFVSMLVQMLEDEGVEVQWQRPHEKRSTGDILEGVVTTLIATGSLKAIQAAVQMFRLRVKGRAKVEIEGDPDDGGFFNG